MICLLPLPRQTGRLRKRDRRGMGVWGGAKSYNSEKAWSSINHSIFSAVNDLLIVLLPSCYSQLLFLPRTKFYSIVSVTYPFQAPLNCESFSVKSCAKLLYGRFQINSCCENNIVAVPKKPFKGIDRSFELRCEIRLNDS